LVGDAKKDLRNVEELEEAASSDEDLDLKPEDMNDS